MLLVDYSSSNAPESSKKSGKDRISEMIHPVEKRLLLALTSASIYFLKFDESFDKAVFDDAPIPILVRVHDILTLKCCTIFFGFQRFILTFVDMKPSIQAATISELMDHSSTEPTVAYMILTRDKSHTYPIVTKIPQVANAARAVAWTDKIFKNVLRMNKDDELVARVTLAAQSLGVDSDVVHYQMLYQVWRHRPGVEAPRTVILTPSLLLLCEEQLNSASVDMIIIDQSAAKEVYKVQLEDDPLLLTIIFKPTKMFASRRKWRLKTDNKGAVSRLQEECRRICQELVA